MTGTAWWRVTAVSLAVLSCALLLVLLLDELTAVTAVIAFATAFVAGFATLALERRSASAERALIDGMRRLAEGDRGARLDAGAVPRALAAAYHGMAASIGEQLALAGQERGRLAAALNSSVDAVLAFDPEDRVAFANAAAEELFERPLRDLEGNPIVWLLPDEQAISAVRTTRERRDRNAIFVAGPKRQHLRMIAAPIAGGGNWAVLAVFHDVTDAKRLEDMRRDFVANVSHELRTPLASVKSVIETLAGGALEDAAAAHEFLGRANGEVDRLVALVEELLELSRIESGAIPMARDPVDIGALLHVAVGRLREQAGRASIGVQTCVSPGLPPVRGDADRLERVIINLLQNALTYSPSGSAIDVRAERGGGSVVVRVQDSGPGIAPADLPRVFERFYKGERGRGGGAGLGLAIVKHTIEGHSGTVSVESREGSGATFSFSIPIEMSPAAAPDSSNDRARSRGPGARP
jgi:two-component system phosphate regulon sensor histidine kinase PhoR